MLAGRFRESVSLPLAGDGWQESEHWSPTAIVIQVDLNSTVRELVKCWLEANAPR
jgi:hypothetical protein